MLEIVQHTVIGAGIFAVIGLLVGLFWLASSPIGWMLGAVAGGAMGALAGFHGSLAGRAS